MGKLVRYLTILIFIEMLFIITGQLLPSSGGSNPGSVGSIIFNAILNLGSLSLQEIFTQSIGQFGDLFNSSSGIGALILGGAVTLGTLFTKNDSILFIPIGFTLALLSLDFIFIANYLGSFNFILSTLLLAPITIIYIITVIEWIRSKD